MHAEQKFEIVSRKTGKNYLQIISGLQMFNVCRKVIEMG